MFRLTITKPTTKDFLDFASNRKLCRRQSCRIEFANHWLARKIKTTVLKHSSYQKRSKTSSDWTANWWRRTRNFVSPSISHFVQLQLQTICSGRQSDETAVEGRHNTKWPLRFGNVWYRSFSTNWKNRKRTNETTMVRRWQSSGSRVAELASGARKRHKASKILRA